LTSTNKTFRDKNNYRETIDFLYGLERFGILLGLDNIVALLDKMGNPQKTFRSVHVAGSNGKGSTASFVSNIALVAGLRTALYTSPHLNDFRERIRLDGKMISRESLVDATSRVRELYDPERTTFFEFTTALAFDCISRFEPDLAVMEVGLGGRLDATNTLCPEVSIITDISLEHQDYLGDSIKAIAREKAGIMKPHTPVVTGASRADARRVIHEEAQRMACPVREFGRDFRSVRTGNNSFGYESGHMKLNDIQLSMFGAHQVKNAGLAIAAIEELTRVGFSIGEDDIRNGIFRTKFPGRFELLKTNPDVIIDGAHTVEGMRLLRSTLRSLYPNRKVFLLLGMLRDKNCQELVQIIAPIAHEIMCVPPQSNRALDPEELFGLVGTFGVPVAHRERIEDGFQYLVSRAGREDIVVAAGSLYMIGPVRSACGYHDV
jgi:dihydrofolate synthase/folylpolyglutamate synthase